MLARAQDVLDHRSRSFVEDATAFARWILRDGKAILDTLTATQTECTRLVEVNRKQLAEIEDWKRRYEAIVNGEPMPPTGR